MTATPIEDLQTVTLTVNGSERTVAVPATRTLLDGHAMPWGQLGIAAVGTLVLIPLAVWFALRMLHTFRARGYVTRYT